ncbi:MAG: DUF177 domain-containing protein [Verrucomicrobia bacterium]|nr:MAG: DUF177 domain-containing protein [Verrucomicrobiota bacterium]
MNPLWLSLRKLEQGEQIELSGELPPEALEIETLDDMLALGGRFRYRLTAELHGRAVLLMGELELPLECTCVRCLKAFRHMVRLEGWSCLASLDDEEEGLPVSGDWVDLTGLLRDSLALAFPQHPLCEPQCRGLSLPGSAGASGSGDASAGGDRSSPWAALDQLEL